MIRSMFFQGVHRKITVRFWLHRQTVKWVKFCMTIGPNPFLTVSHIQKRYKIVTWDISLTKKTKSAKFFYIKKVILLFRVLLHHIALFKAEIQSKLKHNCKGNCWNNFICLQLISNLYVDVKSPKIRDFGVKKYHWISFEILRLFLT